MDRFPRGTAERPPPIFEGDTKIELSPMARGADGVKRFFESKSKEKDGGKKVTKKEAAAKLGFADGTIKNMLTAGKLKGDGKGGVTDESVAAFQNKKIKKEAVKDEQRGAITIDDKELTKEDIAEIKEAMDSDCGVLRLQEDAFQNKTIKKQATNDRENSGDVEALDFFDEHVRHPVETDNKEVQIVQREIPEWLATFPVAVVEEPQEQQREIPEWLATLAKKIYKAGLEHGRGDRDMIYAAGYKAAVREAESIDLDSLYMDVLSGMEVAR